MRMAFAIASSSGSRWGGGAGSHARFAMATIPRVAAIIGTAAKTVVCADASATTTNRPEWTHAMCSCATLDLPRGPERELVRDRDRDYRLSGSECRTLAHRGRVSRRRGRDLRDTRWPPSAGGDADLRHLRHEGVGFSASPWMGVTMPWP